MKNTRRCILIVCLLELCLVSFSQNRGTDVTTPLHALKPDYKVPYGAPTVDSVKKVLDKVFNYLDAATPVELVNRRSGESVTVNKADTGTIFKQGDFRLVSYEWGVTYSGMLLAGAATGDKKYTDYTNRRMQFISEVVPVFKTIFDINPRAPNPVRSIIQPRALDDAGALCAAMIKTVRAGGAPTLRPWIDNFAQYISTKEFRLKDGTLARNRPQKNTLWLDDLYMAVPALAQMGKLTGDKKYFDDCVKQILQFSERMFNKEKGVYMHGWVQEMETHPQFYWARANGWAILTMVELLDVLPESHPGRTQVLQQLQAHAKGLASYQSGEGFWHQLLNRPDSYLETSATAIYAYCLARAANKGWIDKLAYGPMAILAWNAVTTKINSKGQVEGTCVGTGMAFDPAFYYYRPVNVFAAHGYGPVLLAGAEITSLLKNNTFEINDSSLQLKK